MTTADSHSLCGYPIDSSSNLLAQGAYVYYCDGQKMRIKEGWFIHRSESGLWIHSQRVVTEADLCIQVCAQLSTDSSEINCLKGNELQSYDIRWIDTGEQPFTIESEYTSSLCYVTVNSGGHDITIHDLGESDIIFPLLRIFTGGLFLQLLQAGGKARAMVPWIKDPAKRGELLKPCFSERKLEPVDLNVEFKPDDISDDLYSYRCFGGEYQQGASFWLNRYGLLVRYLWQEDDGRQWDVRLENFSGDDAALGMDFGHMAKSA